jgi:hypothetical protein
MTKFYVLVEGHGEEYAAQKLRTRVSQDVQCFTPWSTPLRWQNIHLWETAKGGVRKGADFIRTKQDVAGLLILRDEDDACPKKLAPEMAARLRQMALPFPTAYVLLHPEFEVLFLPCLDRMVGAFPDGRQGLNPDTVWDGASWESRRGIKEWLSKHFPDGRSYKPTMDQLTMTRKVDLPTLRTADVPCFGSLERAVQYLCSNIDRPGTVYPDTLPNGS